MDPDSCLKVSPGLLRGEWEIDDECGGEPVQEVDAAAVASGDLAYDGQAEPGSAGVAAACVVEAGEAFEDVLAVFGRCDRSRTLRSTAELIPRDMREYRAPGVVSSIEMVWIVSRGPGRRGL